MKLVHLRTQPTCQSRIQNWLQSCSKSSEGTSCVILLCCSIVAELFFDIGLALQYFVYRLVTIKVWSGGPISFGPVPTATPPPPPFPTSKHSLCACACLEPEWVNSSLPLLSHRRTSASLFSPEDAVLNAVSA